MDHLMQVVFVNWDNGKSSFGATTPHKTEAGRFERKAL
jgi:hypothetical protein